MKTKNKIIENIIKHHFPIAFNENQYTFQMVKNICQSVWDTANNEVDDICELKAEKAELERRLDLLNEDCKKLTNQLFEQDRLNDLLQLEIADLQSAYSNLETEYDNLKSDFEIKLEEEYERGFEAGDRGNIF